nr:threonine/serine exporter family protein [Gammaproteobacteria bacterium]
MRISGPPSGDVDDPRLVFVLDLARALHAYGMPADRLETMLEAMGEQLDLPVQAFTTPTVILASFGEPPRQRTVM